VATRIFYITIGASSWEVIATPTGRVIVPLLATDANPVTSVPTTTTANTTGALIPATSGVFNAFRLACGKSWTPVSTGLSDAGYLPE
jgi:hypothetical protein